MTEQPRDDDAPDEPTVAKYQRTHPAGQPTHTAGQQAAVEGMAAAHGWTQLGDSYQTGRAYSAADISRRVRGPRRLQPTAEMRALAEQVLAEVIQHERETAAARAAAGDTNPYDLDPYADVHDLAQFYDESRNDPQQLTRFLDNLADELDLTDVRALRTAAAAAGAAMGRIALAAREKGMSADRIAAESGYTASRIAQILREEKQRRSNGAQ